MQATIAQLPTLLEPMQRLLALDIGSKSIGLALSDMSRMIASPHSILARGAIKKDIATLIALIEEEEVGALVVGLPLGLDGQETQACSDIRTFIEKLEKRHDLPVIYQDERFSTHAAQRAMRDASVKRKKRDQLDDKIAAAYFLQTVLDQLP